MEDSITLAILNTTTAADTKFKIRKFGKESYFLLRFDEYLLLFPSSEVLKFADFTLSQLRSNAKEKSIVLLSDMQKTKLNITGVVKEGGDKLIMLSFIWLEKGDQYECFILSSEQAKEIVEVISPHL